MAMKKRLGQYQDLLKLLILGESGVGKTCMLVKFTDGVFDNTMISTVGVEFKQKVVDVFGEKVKLQIWDTSGNERYHSITRNFYVKVKGIIITYDITDRESFERIEKWMSQIREHAESDVKLILVGNKADLSDTREVSKLEGQQMANRFRVPFFETSAKTGESVEAAFQHLAEEVRVSSRSGASDRNGAEGTSALEKVRANGFELKTRKHTIKAQQEASKEKSSNCC